MLARFEHLSGFCTVLNSRFWLEMCTRMIASENTTIEIGLYSFLFTTWDTVFSDTGRRFDLCTGFLLEPGVFETRFNHWCPIVRAYYMRLLCWRIGRHDGDSPPTNVTILKAMRDRLMLAWSHYLWLQDDALRRRALQPPTNPCNPAPSRSLFIVRADTLNDTGSSALSRAGGVPPDLELPIDNHPGPPPKNPHHLVPSASTPRKLYPGAVPTTLIPTTAVTTAPDLGQGDITDDPKYVALSKLGPPKSIPGRTIPRSHPAQALRRCSFKFSLEFQPTAKAPGHIRLFPPRLPKPAEEHLQAHTRKINDAEQLQGIEPVGLSRDRARYTGHALAEWMMIVGECQSFFEQRKKQGVSEDRFVETPTLSAMGFRLHL